MLVFYLLPHQPSKFKYFHACDLPNFSNYLTIISQTKKISHQGLLKIHWDKWPCQIYMCTNYDVSVGENLMWAQLM